MRDIVDQLSSRDLLPASTIAVTLVGSVARGWQHTSSDVDVVVVCAEPFADPRALVLPVPLMPPAVPTIAMSVLERRVEVKYWLDTQIDQLLAKVSWDAFGDDGRVGEQLTDVEAVMLERLDLCVPLLGDEWVDRRRGQLRETAFRAFMITDVLRSSDSLVSAAVGLLDADDIDGAVLCARMAFGCAVDALLISNGEYGTSVKWRVRRFKTVSPPQLSFEDYWAIETMRALADTTPQQWVRDVVARCKDLVLDIEI